MQPSNDQKNDMPYADQTASTFNNTQPPPLNNEQSSTLTDPTNNMPTPGNVNNGAKVSLFTQIIGLLILAAVALFFIFLANRSSLPKNYIKTSATVASISCGTDVLNFKDNQGNYETFKYSPAPAGKACPANSYSKGDKITIGYNPSQPTQEVKVLDFVNSALRYIWFGFAGLIGLLTLWVAFYVVKSRV